MGVISSTPGTHRRLLTFTGRSRLKQAGELVGMVQRLSAARSPIEIQDIVRTAARRLTGADGATFILRDRDCCHYVDEDAVSPLWKGQRFPMSACISGWVMLNRRPVVIGDIYADDRVPHDAYRPTFVKSLAMVPIRQLDPLGAIGNYWANKHMATDDELAVLQALADSTAVAMENIRVYQDLEASRLETLERLALAAEYRDSVTHEHTERVGQTAFLLASELGLPGSEASLIGQAAPLHDLGKLAIPDAILLKPGKLLTAEFQLIQEHPNAGASILADSSYEVLRLAEEIALTHHEWWDGSGYPAGLKEEEIPIGGRIVALADVFDALTHERPYKDAWPVRDAVAEIRRLEGRQFDPAVVEAFLRLGPEKLVTLPNPNLSQRHLKSLAPVA